MAEFIVTVGQKHREGHPLMPELTPNGWLSIAAPDEDAARAAADAALAGSWSMIYTPETFKPEFFPDGEQHRITVPDLEKEHHG